MTDKKKWVLLENDERAAANLADELGISKLLACLLLHRNITNAEEYRIFSTCTIDGVIDPFKFADMGKAVDRILKAVNDKEKILIYGDYDVDGITSVSILMLFLKKHLNTNTDFFIPDRYGDGYGISMASAEKAAAKGYSLIITVDCGITAVDEIEFLNKHHIDVILTDHHSPKEIIPPAYAVLATQTEDCKYPFSHLAGVGIAFKVIHALCLKTGLGDIWADYIDIAAIGTVADVVPLTGENRIIVSCGLNKLQAPTNIGIKALIEYASSKSAIDEFSLGYVIAPRINAAGRMGDVNVAVKLLTAESYDEALACTRQLELYNNERKQTEGEVFNDVIQMIKADCSLINNSVAVISGEKWHQGVIGIVASKLCDKYNKPTILITFEGETGKGSGRSVKGFDLFKALSNCSDFLEKFGGHESAAGLTVSKEAVQPLRKAINEYAAEELKYKETSDIIYIDCELRLSELSFETVKDILSLAPFGNSNEKPSFICKNMKIRDYKSVGKDGSHIKLILGKCGKTINGIAFNAADKLNILQSAEYIDIVFHPEINEWNGNTSVQLHISDIRKSFLSCYSRQDLRELYKYIKVKSVNEGVIESVIVFKTGYEERFNKCLSVEMMLTGLKILSEMGLVLYECIEDVLSVKIIPVKGKNGTDLLKLSNTFAEMKGADAND